MKVTPLFGARSEHEQRLSALHTRIDANEIRNPDRSIVALGDDPIRKPVHVLGLGALIDLALTFG
jgi:hypothetical protein